ncbi:transposase [Desulfovibrio sp. UCD-KL4C]|uniref:IS66 family transposase n=1 Tax=Desulfovibrio sp. UCD-KL4C TaxID=2578120 RepID=UPI0025BD1596|nr:transposase [Desulfovibrio sp. UCD-KL4C]
MFERLGIDILRSTMLSWAIQTAQKCEPLLELFYKKLRVGNIINIDETPPQVLKEPVRKNTTKSYRWMAKGGTERKPVVIFRCSPSRSGTVAEKIVGDFYGFLQSAGYAGYNELEKYDAITSVGCLVHVRIKFMISSKLAQRRKRELLLVY